MVMSKEKDGNGSSIIIPARQPNTWHMGLYFVVHGISYLWHMGSNLWHMGLNLWHMVFIYHNFVVYGFGSVLSKLVMCHKFI
jgi:hypothetical protein